MTPGLRDVRGGCAADVATTTCDTHSRIALFEGILETSAASLILPEAYFTCKSSGYGEGATVPLSGGLVGL